ncbi:MAG: aminopeptidase [Trueperaceae bacterium]|nr:MAG: aminopeptidase [Trueperaceae bacterium]
MAAPDLVRVAHRCLRDLTELEPHHHVLVVTDDETADVAEAWSAAAAALAAEVVTIRMEPRRRHGEEPPPAVAQAMLGADLIVQAVSRALTHTDASRAAMARGSQVFVLRGITAAMMRGELMKVDYAELRRVTGALAARLQGGEAAHLTSPAGTDLRFGLEGRSAFALAGGTGPGRFGGARSGEAAIAPVEGSAEGVIVIEHAMDDLGALDAPIRLTCRAGRVARIEGGASAAELGRMLAEAGEGADNLAEVAIGTNPAARLSDNLAEAKKVRGTVHVALGDNVSLGGSVRSGLHLDGMVLAPTLSVDGDVLVRDGVLQ